LTEYDIIQVPHHEGGRNHIYICSLSDDKCVLRASSLNDRTEEDYLAETEFVHFLAQNGAPVADVLPSINHRYVESVNVNGQKMFLCLFACAEGMLISDNGYRYREGAPLEEYFYNTGKALGIIHRLSKEFAPRYRRAFYWEKYNPDYIDSLIPDSYKELKGAIARRLERFRLLPTDRNSFGLVHFDFSDGNYHIDMNTGKITVFDFDNCMNCWYMFDLANLWTHGVGWCQHEEEADKRRKFMEEYFSVTIKGYTSETSIAEEMLNKLPSFIDMVLIENIVDELECCKRKNEELDYEHIATAAHCLIADKPFAGFY
jgi:Ser/Thr protein kinase RdoA (MazF antagonist)